MVPETFIQNLVKIGSVTAEIFLIWTHVTRTNVDRKNVTIIVGIYSRWSQEPTFKIWSKVRCNVHGIGGESYARSTDQKIKS